MSEIRKHCSTCRYSYLQNEQNGLEGSGSQMQHCSNRLYNSPAYTLDMLMEDWGKGYCRLWEPKAGKENKK